MSYSIKFSDPSKTTVVVVPDMPPGINTVDTSLSLVGKGYPNYGYKIAENFVHLLENFAGPYPPENPVEGQLWFDTTDPNNKKLRINDGSANQGLWPNANGIYQQPTDPTTERTSGLKSGDIWVDTSVNQMKIYSAGEWVVIGPFGSGTDLKNGPEPIYLNDISAPPVSYPAVLNWVAGHVVSIYAYNSFTPKKVYDGFSVLVPGINIATWATFNGISASSKALIVNNQKLTADKFLRKEDGSLNGQVISGRVVWQTPASQTSSVGRDGIVIQRIIDANSEFIQLYKSSNDALLLNNTAAGKLIFKVKPSLASGLGTNLISIITADATSVGINTGTTHATLDVYGTAKVLSTLTVTSSADIALSVTGGATVNKDLTVMGVISAGDDVNVEGQLYVNGPNPGSAILPVTTNVSDIGSIEQQFRRVYAQKVGTTSTQYYGTINGSAQSLTQYTTYRLRGHMTSTSVLSNGDGQSVVELTANVTPQLISDQVAITSATVTATILVNQSGTLNKITKYDFLNDALPAGSIVTWGGANTPNGWLLCNGTSYPVPSSGTLLYNLYSVVGTRFTPIPLVGTGVFCVPNLSPLTASTVTVTTIVNYLIKY